MSDAKLSDTVGEGKKAEKSAEKAPPKKKGAGIHVRAIGRVSAIMDQLGAIYRAANPDRDCRWVSRSALWRQLGGQRFILCRGQAGFPGGYRWRRRGALASGYTTQTT